MRTVRDVEVGSTVQVPGTCTPRCYTGVAVGRLIHTNTRRSNTADTVRPDQPGQHTHTTGMSRAHFQAGRLLALDIVTGYTISLITTLNVVHYTQATVGLIFIFSRSTDQVKRPAKSSLARCGAASK